MSVGIVLGGGPGIEALHDRIRMSAVHLSGNGRTDLRATLRLAAGRKAEAHRRDNPPVHNSLGWLRPDW